MPINFDEKFQPMWSYLGQHVYTIYIPPCTLIKIQRKFPTRTLIPTCTIIWNVTVVVLLKVTPFL